MREIGIVHACDSPVSFALTDRAQVELMYAHRCVPMNRGHSV